jgi:hypothetical protein
MSGIEEPYSIFACLKCRTRRIFGNGRAPDNRVVMLRCRHCEEATVHTFVGYEFDRYTRGMGE